MRVVSSIAVGLVAVLVMAAVSKPCLAQDAGYRVQGIWDAHYPTPWGIMSERLILLHNGTFTKSARCNGKMAFFTGRYAVGPGFIRLVHDRGPIRTETTWFEFEGPNQIQCHDRIIGTTWSIYRVGP
jgi:hypothetical protein